MIRVLMVCTGNICRSPTAEGVLRGLSARFEVDSAGTHSYHVGEAPDPRSVRAAFGRGYDLSDQRARQFRMEDFDRFDWILAMDRGHREFLLKLARTDSDRSKIRLLLDFSARWPSEDVPDPYYDDEAAFERVLDRVEEGCTAFVQAMLDPQK